MDGGFTKLSSSIITSSIWCEDDKTRIVWITLLALADRLGEVAGTAPGIANAARVSLDDCVKALDKFGQPDPYSTSSEHEGRRVERIEGGYRILNYSRYRQRRDPEERREYQRQWDREHRPSGQSQPDTTRHNPTQPDTTRHNPTQPDTARHNPTQPDKTRHNPTQPDTPDKTRQNPTNAEAEAEAEKNTSAGADVCPERNEKPVSQPDRPRQPARRIVFDYENSQFTGITEADWQAWEQAYPAVDVRVEAKRAAIWLRDNPAKRKRNVAGFLSRWFARTQERGGTRDGPPPGGNERGGIKAAMNEFFERHKDDDDNDQAGI